MGLPRFARNDKKDEAWPDKSGNYKNMEKGSECPPFMSLRGAEGDEAISVGT